MHDHWTYSLQTHAGANASTSTLSTRSTRRSAGRPQTIRGIIALVRLLPRRRKHYGRNETPIAAARRRATHQASLLRERQGLGSEDRVRGKSDGGNST